MKSLVIIAHPRTMTTQVYQALERGLVDLKPLPDDLACNPDLDQVGEVLNRSKEAYPGGKRLMPYGVVPYDEKVYYIDGSLYEYEVRGNFSREHVKNTVFDILDRYSEGYLLKVVTQPWLVSEYVKSKPGRMRTLHIRRNLTDVVQRMDHHGWYLPITMSGGRTGENESLTRLLARGLVRTEREIFNRMDFDAVLEFERLIWEPDSLWETVEPLGYGVKPVRWFGRPQEEIRTIRLAVRKTDHWKECDRIVREEIERYERKRTTV